MSETKNYSNFAKGPCGDTVSKATAPSGEGKDAWKNGSGGGQTSGSVQHKRDKKDNIENLDGMPSSPKGSKSY